MIGMHKNPMPNPHRGFTQNIGLAIGLLTRNTIFGGVRTTFDFYSRS